MSPDPRTVLQLAKEIVDAEEALKSLQHRWEELFESDSARDAIVEHNAKLVSHRDISFASKVENLLLSSPNDFFSIKMVASMLDTDSLKVGRTLFRLANTGKIENRGRGLYQAKAATTKSFVEEESLDLVMG